VLGLGCGRCPTWRLDLRSHNVLNSTPMVIFPKLAREMGASSTLTLQCGRCGHMQTFNREQALKLYGPDATPYDVRRNSRCSECGERGNVVAFI